jgi:hypothetical protein
MDAKKPAGLPTEANQPVFNKAKRAEKLSGYSPGWP